MRKDLDQYLLRLLKEHLIYIGGLALLIILSVVAVSIFWQRYDEQQVQISTLQQELDGLNQKTEMIRYSQEIERKNIDIMELNKSFAHLLPEKEDFFSIIVALERLSQNTKFLITEYGLNLEKSDVQRLSLSVIGSGDTQSFIKFLNEYNFGGGRLITMDSIKLNNVGYDELKLNVNFYTGKNAPNDKLVKFTPEDEALILRVQDKLRFINDTGETTTSPDYEKKNNPFQ